VQQTSRMWLGYAGLSEQDVSRIDTPTLLVTGDRDVMLPLEHTLALYRTLPSAELAVCPNTGHSGPMSPERAGLFAALIRDFATRHRPAR
jgi:pimeloyl-ACP methyl ester carboxylesterase